MNEFRFLSHSEAETDQLGQWLAEGLQPDTVVALIGTLGAGKTRLVQAVATALGVPRDQVTSPTFVLVNEYQSGRLPVYHFDTYRLRDEDELQELGPEEYFQRGGITFIEWADRFAEFLPKNRLTISIESLGPSEREFYISTVSPSHDPLILKLENWANPPE